LVVSALLYVAFGAIFGYSFSQDPANRNVSVDTTVNITNSIPEVIFVQIEGGAANITINAGTNRTVLCNATVRDWNGGATITNVSATFYHNATSNSTYPDDNNNHYTDYNCSWGNADNYTRNFTCTFYVQYYANPGIWICNVTAYDSLHVFNESVANFSRSLWNRTNINALYALNVTPLIDYQNLSVGDTSDPQQANVTNLGNMNINISVRGFGNTSYLQDGLGMYCFIGNINVSNQKYNLIGGNDITQYRNLTNASAQIPGLTVTNDSQPVINSTYWVLYVPPNPFGRCNGTIVFQAERA
jgi:hypothetical protein